MVLLGVHDPATRRGAAEVADRVLYLQAGGAALDIALDWMALAVVVDNPTNQWLYLGGPGVFVPQYTLGATYSISATRRAQASFTAPSGQVNPPTIAAQVATITFYSLALAPMAGVGMLGGRAPFYDRNPIGLLFTIGQNVVGPTGALIVDWTYTVPAGRRAVIDSAQCIAELVVSDGSGTQQEVYAGIQFRLLGSASNVATFILAVINNGVVRGARADTLALSAKQLQSTDQIRGIHSNPRGAGVTAFLQETVTLTEFDV